MEIAIRDGSLIAAGFPTVAEGLRALGVEVVEVQVDRDHTARSLTSEDRLHLGDEAGVRRLAEEARAHGIRICALLCAQDFNGDRAAAIDYVAVAARAAQAVGAAAVRIDSIMTGQRELPLDERIRIYADGCRAALAATAATEVALGIENHGHQGNDPAWMAGVLAAVADRRLGVTLDVGNWYWYGHPLSRVYEIYRQFGPRVKHTHVKNIAYPPEIRETQREIGYRYGEFRAPLPDGDLDMARVVAILRECGYDGALCIEDESLGKFPTEERPGVLRRDIACLRAAIGAAT